jgi:hypothetical protein
VLTRQGSIAEGGSARCAAAAPALTGSARHVPRAGMKKNTAATEEQKAYLRWLYEQVGNEIHLRIEEMIQVDEDWLEMQVMKQSLPFVN